MFKIFKLDLGSEQKSAAKVSTGVDIQVQTELAFQFNVNTKEVDIFPNFVWDQPETQKSTQNEARNPNHLDLL